MCRIPGDKRGESVCLAYSQSPLHDHTGAGAQATLMFPPNETWGGIIRQAGITPDVLKQAEVRLRFVSLYIISIWLYHPVRFCA